MKRSMLDAVVRAHGLDQPAVEAALDLTGSRPDAAAWRRFAVRILTGAGIAGVGAGIVFFVAANWQGFGIFGRFALLEASLVAAVATALWRPPPAAVGRASLFLATLLAGGLLALHGQSYQTGADIYELFLAWSALTLPFALAGASGTVWALWWVVANTAMALFCGWLGPGHVLWGVFDHWGFGRPSALLGPFAVNLAAAALFAHLATTRFADHAPRWLVRLLAGLGFLYGTAAALWVLKLPDAGGDRHGPLVVAAFAVACLVVIRVALRRRRDVFPLALVIASWIVISTAWIGERLPFSRFGDFLLIALWLVASASAAAYALMHWVRAWGIDEDAPREAAA